MLDAGISVLTTVNVQHLESLNDVVEQITGVPPAGDGARRRRSPGRPDRAGRHVPRGAAPPARPRQRLPRRGDRRGDCGTTSAIGNLTALRELALLWLADRVDEGLRRYKTEHAIDRVWEARERVVVALTGGREGDTLIRRARQDRLPLRPRQRDRPPGGPRAGRRRPGRRVDHGAAAAAAARGEPRRQLPPGGRERHPGGVAGVRARRGGHTAGHRHQPPLPVGPSGAGGDRRGSGGALRRDRRPHRHAFRRRPARAPAAAADGSARSPPPLVGAGPDRGRRPGANGDVPGRLRRSLARRA